ncbi:MAG: type II toxin-antitoxin system PemK/MazF family toxin [Dolichospermum sp.]
MYRGEIWWASLPAPIGSEPGYRRPVLIVQDDIFNQNFAILLKLLVFPYPTGYS